MWLLLLLVHIEDEPADVPSVRESRLAVPEALRPGLEGIVASFRHLGL